MSLPRRSGAARLNDGLYRRLTTRLLTTHKDTHQRTYHRSRKREIKLQSDAKRVGCWFIILSP
jgi:hypothetical protein